MQKSPTAFSRAGLFVVASVVLTGVAPAAKAAPPSFSSTVQPIFNDNCVACHQKGSAQQGLVLEDGEAFAHLAGRKSQEAPLSLVTPGQPEQSYLVRKLEGTHLNAGGAGERMPMGGAPLSAAELETIRQWIAAGAQNN